MKSKVMRKSFSAILKIIHIIHIFGTADAFKYIYYRKIKKNGFANCGKEMKLHYDHHNLMVRIDSTDLILVKTILIGELVNRKWLGEYNQVEEFIKNLSVKHPIIVDAGANIGLFSRLILKKCPNARIYAIEPEESNYQLLKYNMRNYSAKILRGGVWPHDCMLKVISRDTGNWGFIVKEVHSGDSSCINAISINSLMKKYNLERIDVLKMDVEGSEYEIFNSLDLDWLDVCQAIVIETHDHIVKGSDELVNRILLERGFVKSTYGENQLFIRKK